MTGGRYFQSIEAPEGEKLTNAVIDLIGEDDLIHDRAGPEFELARCLVED